MILNKSASIQTFLNIISLNVSIWEIWSGFSVNMLSLFKPLWR